LTDYRGLFPVGSGSNYINENFIPFSIQVRI
jgi:hypothetical protein